MYYRLADINVKRERHSLNAIILYGNLSLYDFDDILQRCGIILSRLLDRIYCYM